MSGFKIRFALQKCAPCCLNDSGRHRLLYVTKPDKRPQKAQPAPVGCVLLALPGWAGNSSVGAKSSGKANDRKSGVLTVSLFGSNSFRILKKFLPYCLSPLMNRFCDKR